MGTTLGDEERDAVDICYLLAYIGIIGYNRYRFSDMGFTDMGKSEGIKFSKEKFENAVLYFATHGGKNVGKKKLAKL